MWFCDTDGVVRNPFKVGYKNSYLLFVQGDFPCSTMTFITFKPPFGEYVFSNHLQVNLKVIGSMSIRLARKKPESWVDPPWILYVMIFHLLLDVFLFKPRQPRYIGRELVLGAIYPGFYNILPTYIGIYWWVWITSHLAYFLAGFGDLATRTLGLLR